MNNAKTFAQWNSLGFRIKKGSKSCGQDKDGNYLFESDATYHQSENYSYGQPYQNDGYDDVGMGSLYGSCGEME